MGSRRRYQYKTVTPELVEKVKDFSKRFPEMLQKDIAEYTGWTSPATVSRILNGEYDHLIQPLDYISNGDEEDQDTIRSMIETFYFDALESLTQINATLNEIRDVICEGESEDEGGYE